MNSYVIDGFTVFYSNLNVDQMAEALAAYFSNMEDGSDERCLAISAEKSIITVFTPQFAQLYTHAQVALNNSLLRLQRIPRILRVTVQQKKTTLIIILYVPYSVPFHACSTHSVSHPLFRNSKISKTLHIATICVKMTSINHLQKESKMLPFQDHLSLISSRYLARALQSNNRSHNVVTSSSGIRNMK